MDKVGPDAAFLMRAVSALSIRSLSLLAFTDSERRKCAEIVGERMCRRKPTSEKALLLELEAC